MRFIKSKFRDPAYRKKSFTFIETFIDTNIKNWDKSPDTDSVGKLFTAELKKLNNIDFAFLVLHSGFIPEIYTINGKQEKLYTKLVEILVCEWAIRIGFKQSVIQKKKSNIEDVTIKRGTEVIVCDAKANRMGRSQKAPNVKDTIKKEAYSTWLKKHPVKDRIGGLVTFPSLLSWIKESEVYKYFSSGNPPVTLLFYEHMSFILLYGINANRIIDLQKNYKAVFNKASNSQTSYLKEVEGFLLKGKLEKWREFKRYSDKILREKVKYTIASVNQYLTNERTKLKRKIAKLNQAKLKEQLLKAEFQVKYSKVERQLQNINKKFLTNSLP